METNKHLIHVVKYKFIWFTLSAILLIPGIIGMIYLPYIEDDKVRTDAIKLYLELSVEDIIKIKERFEKVGLYPIDKN